MKVIGLLVIAFVSLSTALLAQVEGVAHFRGTTKTGQGETISGRSSFTVSSNAVRIDWEMDLREGQPDTGKKGKPRSYRTTMIQKLAEPDKTYVLNDEQKTYSVIDQKRTGAKPDAGQKFSVKRLGRDSVAGFSCESVLLTSPAGMETRACLTKDLVPSDAWLAAISNRERSEPMAALHANGLDGFPIRWQMRNKGEKENSSTFELVSFERKPVPASAFQIPAGYKETSASANLMTPEQRKAMKDALSRMTPEQRKQYDEMVKRQQEKQQEKQ